MQAKAAANRLRSQSTPSSSSIHCRPVVNAGTGEPKSTNDDSRTQASLYVLCRTDANLFQRFMVESTGVSSLHLSTGPGSPIAFLRTYGLISGHSVRDAWPTPRSPSSLFRKPIKVPTSADSPSTMKTATYQRCRHEAVTRLGYDYEAGMAADTWAEYALSTPLVFTAVTT
jgi:hypothetical protein